MIIHAIDPGVEYYARADFHGPRLQYVHIFPLKYDVSQGWADVGCVIEMPQIYAHAPARKNDVANLIYATGRIAAQYKEVTRYTPAQWKGQVPKKIHQKRVLDALTPKEMMALDGLPKKDLVHILDAVGIGLFHLGRLAR